jgi:hypothetical protein
MRALLSRSLHLLKWFPPFWLTAMLWATWGTARMRELGVPLPVLTDASSAVQHLDAAAVLLLFGGALIYRLFYRPRVPPMQAVWVGLSLAFVALGVLSSVLNESPAFDAAGSMLSLGRNALYFSALSLLTWSDRDRRHVFLATMALVTLNVVAVGVQWLLFTRVNGLGIPEDAAVGAFGFANDAALLNLTGFVGVLLSTLPAGRRVWSAAVLLLAGLASAFLTGTVVTLALIPLIWMLARRTDPLTFVTRAIAGYGVAALGIYVAFRLMSALMGPMVESYTAQVWGQPPGVVTGAGLIAHRIAATNLGPFIGLGPGRVNSRGAVKSGATLMPELTLPSVTGMSKLTYFQMNQSVLVALAEFGWLCVTILTAFWALVVRRVRRAALGDHLSGLEDAYILSRLAGIVVVFFLGFLSLGWNESPFAYSVLLSAAPLIPDVPVQDPADA